MRRFHDPYQRLLQVRQQTMKQQEVIVLRRHNALRQAGRQLAHLEAKLAETSTYIARHLNHQRPTNIWDGLRCGAHLEREMRQTQQTVKRARDAYHEALARFQELSVQVEALKLLRQQRMNKHRAQNDRYAQQQLDELAMSRWTKAPNVWEASDA